jgi:hypothetical protein
MLDFDLSVVHERPNVLGSERPVDDPFWPGGETDEVVILEPPVFEPGIAHLLKARRDFRRKLRLNASGCVGAGLILIP